MWWHLSVPTMANKKLMSADNSLWLGTCLRCMVCAWICSWRVGWLVASFETSRLLCWDFRLLSLKAEGEFISVQHGWSAKVQVAHIYIFFFNLSPFSVPLHAASPPTFSKSPLRALLKARSGSEVTLECKPQASPPAISLWKKGNEILQRTER